MDTRPTNRRKPALICLCVMVIATGLRLLSWQDNRFDVAKVEWVVAKEYQEAAQVLSRGDVSAYLHNPSYMTHPPGYALLRATIFKTLSSSDTTVQWFPIRSDVVA